MDLGEIHVEGRTVKWIRVAEGGVHLHSSLSWWRAFRNSQGQGICVQAEWLYGFKEKPYTL